MELQVQFFRRAAAQEHAVHEDLKILDHRAHLRVDGERETDLLVGERDLVLFDGVVDAVVDVEGRCVLIAHAAAAPQHDATILVQSSDGQLRGLIASQPQLYEQLIASRRATCYGLVRKANDDYCGEVCIRIR